MSALNRTGRQSLLNIKIQPLICKLPAVNTGCTLRKGVLLSLVSWFDSGLTGSGTAGLSRSPRTLKAAQASRRSGKRIGGFSYTSGTISKYLHIT